jgi:hypothetical protein
VLSGLSFGCTVYALFAPGEVARASRLLWWIFLLGGVPAIVGTFVVATMIFLLLSLAVRGRDRKERSVDPLPLDTGSALTFRPERMDVQFRGTGLRYVGIGPLDQHDEACATLWVTALFIPLVPLARYRLKALPFDGKRLSEGFECEVVGRTRLVWSEVFVTYVASCTFFSLCLAGPIYFAITWGPKVQGIWQFPFITGFVLVVLSLLFALLIWSDSRLRPRGS